VQTASSEKPNMTWELISEMSSAFLVLMFLRATDIVVFGALLGCTTPDQYRSFIQASRMACITCMDISAQHLRHQHPESQSGH